MQRPRIVLAEQLRSLLALEFDVVAVVSDGQALLRAAEAAKPDVVVTDIVMPELDGIAATAALLAKQPAVRVVLVTVHDDPELVERAQTAGALGFVAKHHAGHELVPAVKAVLRGERYVSRRGPSGRS